MVPSVNYQNQP